MRRYKEALDALRFTEEEQAMLTKKLEQAAEAAQPPHEHRSHMSRRIAVLAAVLAALVTVSAFAASIPALREALQKALGGFSAQSQTITGVSAAEDGIEVRPVAALSDSGMTLLYLEIEDRSGDRLAGGYDVDIDIQHPLDNEPVHLGTHSRQISYDAETHTALYEAWRPDSIPAADPSAAVEVWLLDPQADSLHQSIGHWAFTIDLERAAERHYTPDAAIHGRRLFDVRISALSLCIIAENGVTDPTQPGYDPVDYTAMPVTLTLRDGTVVDVTADEQNRLLATDAPPSDNPQAEYEQYYHSKVQWRLEQPVEPDDVVSITLFGQTIPLVWTD